ncbi:MAG: hypothetical protein CR986_10715 [Ignavibacteriae bacterium]|nr:MAG: hypothetical protein CR986_10715 [Ignavibacteriota bacterium]
MKKGWKVVALKDACKVFTDGNWIQTKNQSTDGIRLIQTGNIGFGVFKNKIEKARYISEETFIKLKCTEIFPNDLLVSRLPDPVGKSCIIPNIDSKMITGVDCTIIRTKYNLLSRFLLYFQMSDIYLKDVNLRVTGTTRSRISRKNLGLVEIPIPPLDEQKRIVAILDEVFATIEKAKTNAEKNLQNAKELFKSYLNNVFENGKLKIESGEWEEKKLEEVCEKLFDAIKDRGLYGYTNIEKVKQNCVTVSARGSGTGHTELRTEPFYPIVRLIVLIPNEKYTNYKFLKLMIDNLDIFRSGSAIPQLTVPMMKQHSVFLPPLPEQKRIVEKLDKLSAKTKKRSLVST